MSSLLPSATPESSPLIRDCEATRAALDLPDRLDVGARVARAARRPAPSIDYDPADWAKGSIGTALAARRLTRALHQD